MTRIKITEQYKLDYKREKRGRHRARLDKKLLAAVIALTADAALPGQICDLVLGSNLQDCLYYPIRPHFIMIYRKSGDGILELVRLGAHSELSILHNL